MRKVGKFLSDILTLAGIIVLVWFTASMIEVSENNTTMGYEYSDYNLITLIFQTE